MKNYSLNQLHDCNQQLCDISTIFYYHHPSIHQAIIISSTIHLSLSHIIIHPLIVSSLSYIYSSIIIYDYKNIKTIKNNTHIDREIVSFLIINTHLKERRVHEVKPPRIVIDMPRQREDTREGGKPVRHQISL